MSPSKVRRRAPRASADSPPARRRIMDAGLGAVSGAVVGALGIVFMAPFSPPVLLTVGGLASLGAAGGYRWGRRVHAALWEAFINVSPHG